MGQDLQQIHADIGNLPWEQKTCEKANDIGYLDLTPKLAAKSSFQFKSISNLIESMYSIFTYTTITILY